MQTRSRFVIYEIHCLSTFYSGLPGGGLNKHKKLKL